MPRISKIILAEKNLLKFLDEGRIKVLSPEQLEGIIERHRVPWGLPATTRPEKIIEKFVSIGTFKKIVLATTLKEFERFLYNDPHPYEVAVSLRPKSFLSHYPAMSILGLTTQVPKTIYTTHELSEKIRKPVQISQEAIDAAFSKSQRRSSQETIYEDYKIVLLDGMFTNRSGIITDTTVPLTNPERTLIDATVRPDYAGGCFSVLEAYRIALAQKVSVNKLAALLNKYNFIYPYHQAVGFYLEKAGYTGNLLDLFKRNKFQFDFYLDYGMPEKKYSKEWRIYYPKGM